MMKQVAVVRLCLIAMASTGLVSCASLQRGKSPSNEAATENTQVVVAPGEVAKSEPNAESPAPNDLDDTGKDLSAIPIEVNRHVLEWVDYFQGRGREHMERYLARSGRYIPLMKEILKREGVPEDLVYIALIESGFSSSAKSTASAVGFWQFIRPTGLRYGLQINSYVDERRDFVRSTVAAADYFKGLYNLFGSWYLAMASYNVGENRVKSLVMKYHTRDFWQLAKEGKLPKETINYVPKFTAARLIAREPEKYGFTNVEYAAPLDYVELSFNHSVDLKKMADELGMDVDDLKSLNPSFKRGVAIEKEGRLLLRVPKNMSDKAVAAAHSAPASSPKAYVIADEDDVSDYRIRNGDTLSGIARKFNTSARKLRKLNNLPVSAKLVVGRKLKVPNDLVAGMGQPNSNKVKKNRKRQVANVRSASTRPAHITVVRKVHIVRSGESLAKIAKHYNVSLSSLKVHNRLSQRTKLVSGAKLFIPRSHSL